LYIWLNFGPFRHTYDLKKKKDSTFYEAWLFICFGYAMCNKESQNCNFGHL